MVNRPQTISKLELAGTKITRLICTGIVVQCLQEMIRKNSPSWLDLPANPAIKYGNANFTKSRGKARERRPELGESRLGPVVAVFHILGSIRTNRATTQPESNCCKYFSSVFFILPGTGIVRHTQNSCWRLPLTYSASRKSMGKSHWGPSKRLHALHPAEKEKAPICI